MNELVDLRYGRQVYRISAFPDDHITRQIKAAGNYEMALLNAIAAEQQYGVYVDVGAFIGTHTIFFARHCDSLMVFAFEPCAASFEVLNSNLARSCRIKTVAFPWAASDHWTRVRTVNEAGGNMGMHHTIPRPMTDSMAALALPLDSMLSWAPRIACIKIDVEGDEFAVLGGAEGIIHRDRPLLVVESTEKALFEGWADQMNYDIVGTYNATPTHLCRPRT